MNENNNKITEEQFGNTEQLCRMIRDVPKKKNGIMNIILMTFMCGFNSGVTCAENSEIR